MKIFEWVHRKFRNGKGVKDGRGAWEEDLKGHKRDEKGYAEEEEEVRNDLTGLLAIGTLGLQTLPQAVVEEEEEEEELELELEDEKDEEARVQVLCKQLEEALGLPSSDCPSSPMQQQQEKQNVYPLHEFLHSPLADHNPTKTRNVKESRTSLGDLFSKSTQKSSPPPKVPLPSHLPNTSAKLGGHLGFVKKLLGQKTGKNSSQAVDPGRHKLVKVIGQFRKKIHPEEMAASCVNAARSRISRSKDKKSFFRLASCIHLCQGDGHCGDMEAVDTECHQPHLVKPNKQPCTNEHWIKTDAEYVVLEL